LEDVHAFLQRNQQTYDVVVSADTLVYIGQLDTLFAGVRQALKLGGCFSFTIEATSASTFALKQSKRYGHAMAYIEYLAKRNGMQILAIESDIIRHEQPVPIQGFNLLLKKC
jgi:predicted TPR repeat methyltransferase